MLRQYLRCVALPMPTDALLDQYRRYVVLDIGIGHCHRYSHHSFTFQRDQTPAVAQGTKVDVAVPF